MEGTCADKLSVLCKLLGFGKVIFYVRPLLVPSLMSRGKLWKKGVGRKKSCIGFTQL